MTDHPPIGSAEIMERIRNAIRSRQESSGLSAAEFEALATGTDGPSTVADLRRDLERLEEAMHYSSVELMLSDVRPSLFSGLIQRLRSSLHEAILFYVNRFAAQQAVTNQLNLRALKTALALIEAQEARINELEHKSVQGP